MSAASVPLADSTSGSSRACAAAVLVRTGAAGSFEGFTCGAEAPGRLHAPRESAAAQSPTASAERAATWPFAGRASLEWFMVCLNVVDGCATG